MKKITKNQLIKIHTLLNKLSLLPYKSDMVSNLTQGRTESTKELSAREAAILIMHLAELDIQGKSNFRMVKKVFALAYEAEIIYGDSEEDRKMNIAKLNQFLRERGTVKKEISALTHNELTKVVSQFQKIVDHKNEAKAKKATDSLLKELNLKTH